jgi:hypothetical protein
MGADIGDFDVSVLIRCLKQLPVRFTAVSYFSGALPRNIYFCGYLTYLIRGATNHNCQVSRATDRNLTRTRSVTIR